MTIHPKTNGAALGAALGFAIVSVLASIHGVHLTADANAAIPAFLSTLGAFLMPSPDPVTVVSGNAPSPPPPVQQVPPPA
jgi:hypothetical protein